MTIEKRNKLIYSGELIFFAAVFLVIGILELLKVIILSERFQLIFKIITLVGVAWIITDFIWTLKSQKRRENYGMLDKILVLPVAIYLLVFDIVGFAIKQPYEYYQVGVPFVFFFLACIYVFEGIFHYYNPLPLLVKAIEEEIKEKEMKEAKKIEELEVIENKEEIPEEKEESKDKENVEE